MAPARSSTSSGDVFPANQLERMFREMYARNLTEDVIKDRIVEDVDTQALRRITESTLEGLAKRELNLSAIVGKSAEAKERRLVPEVIEDFFMQAAPHRRRARQRPTGRRSTSTGSAACHVCCCPWREAGKPLRQAGPRVQADRLRQGHPCTTTRRWSGSRPAIRCLRAFAQLVLDQVQDDLQRGAVFYDLQRRSLPLLDVYSAEIRDGRGNVLHKRLFVD